MNLLDYAEEAAIRRAKTEGRKLKPSLREKLRLAEKEVQEIAKIAQDPLSLDCVIHDELPEEYRCLERFLRPQELRRANDEALCLRELLGDFIEDQSTPTPSAVASARSLVRHLNRSLRCLTSRERRVIEMRYGLKNGRKQTLEEIGQEFDVTRERIRQLEQRALRKLRHPARSRVLGQFL